jgi:mRNA-degrading endonuclease RelE of RelBE toxin-antitoxin system
MIIRYFASTQKRQEYNCCLIDIWAFRSSLRTGRQASSVSISNENKATATIADIHIMFSLLIDLKRKSNGWLEKFASLKNEFAELLSDILANPEMGTSLCNNCYKIRLAIGSKGKGKRGAARVITYLYFESETVYLLTIYDTAEKSNLKAKEIKEINKSLELE